MSGGPSRTVAVIAGNITQVPFTLTCTAPPVVTAGPDQQIAVGLLFTLDGASFSDPDHDAPWNVTIDWGDGKQTAFSTSSEGTIGGSHSYPVTLLGKDYTLTITVEDAHGNRRSASKTVKVLVA